MIYTSTSTGEGYPHTGFGRKRQEQMQEQVFFKLIIKTIPKGANYVVGATSGEV